MQSFMDFSNAGMSRWSFIKFLNSACCAKGRLFANDSTAAWMISLRGVIVRNRFDGSTSRRPVAVNVPLASSIVLDRVIQQALAQVLGPLFEPGFSRFSYGFRAKRGAHDAVRQAREYRKQGYKVAVDCDLAKFFDSVNCDVLMCRVSARVSDLHVRRLIWRYSLFPSFCAQRYAAGARQRTLPAFVGCYICITNSTSPISATLPLRIVTAKLCHESFLWYTVCFRPHCPVYQQS
jgi:hypothetical protein